MSRCFPFPPPGYEKKAIIDDADLLKKEKHREKKHKKEKKDKEKKEGKEKREKDRSDSKHRDKKDRKEKHRDKKEKEKDKDKDKKAAGPSETYNGEKAGQKERDPDKGSSSISNEKRLVQSGENHDRKSLLSEGAGDYKFVQELGRRIRDEGTGSQMVNKFHGDELKGNKQNQRAVNFFGKDTGTLAEGKGKNDDKRYDLKQKNVPSGNAVVQNHAGMAQNSISGMARPLEKNIPSGNAVVPNHAGMAQNSISGMARPLEKNILSGNAVVQNSLGMTQNRFDRVARPVEKNVDLRPSGNAVVQNLSGMGHNSSGGMAKPPEKSVSSGSAGVQSLDATSQIRGDGMGRPLEKKVETRMDEKEKLKEKEGDEKRGDKRKGKDREKKSHGKDKEREKDKKKEKGEHKSKNPDKLKDRSKNNLPDPSSVRASDVSKNGGRSNSAEENLNKRKHSETNGFLHETDTRPNKVLRLPPHPSTENGSKLEPPESIHQLTSDKRGPSVGANTNKEHKANGLMEAPVSSNVTATTQAERAPQASKKPPPPLDSKYPSTTPKVEEKSGFDSKEHKGKNGLIQAAPQPLPVSSSKSSSTTKADRALKPSKKPPHPDTKYLGQVLSIPKMEEWSDFDEQEWLLCSSKKSSSSSSSSSVNKTDAMVVDTPPRVWAEALKIDSADVCALPYVIPF